jgi:SAM-dependent methyltransferase
MITLAKTPEAAAIAAKYGVSPEIHDADFIYEYHLGPDRDAWDARRPGAIDYYFADGAKSASQLNDLVSQLHPESGHRQLTLFEFASGYGCVSRHLKMMNYDLLACDIHENAIAFLTDVLNVKSLLSHRDPKQLKIDKRFDVVFALSFFTHMPLHTWGLWLTKLFDVLADDGLLIFTTHGRTTYEDGGRPPLDRAGYWFGGASEQKDLPLEDYRTMIVTPWFAFQQIEQFEHATLISFREASWWGKQDTYIIRRNAAPFGRERQPTVAQVAGLEAENKALREAIDIIHASRSWRITAPMRDVGRLMKRSR